MRIITFQPSEIAYQLPPSFPPGVVQVERDTYHFECKEQQADIFKLKERLANPEAFAAAAPAASEEAASGSAAPAAEEKKDEEEEGSDDDMGFGLFD